MKHRTIRLLQRLLITVLVCLPIMVSGSSAASQQTTAPIATITAGPGRAVPQTQQHLLSTQLSTLSNSPVNYYNWSGYAVTSATTFNKVQTTFIQPKVTCTTPGAWTLFWVGFDGFQNNTVEQAGTAAQCSNTSTPTPTYYAWWEMYPTMNIIPDYSVPIRPGDSIQANVYYSVKTTQFSMRVTDLTTTKAFSHSANCATGLVCARASAEWIVERPTSNGVYTPLANWGSMKLSQAQASVSTTYTVSMKSISAYSNTPINMVSDQNTSIFLAKVGALNTTGNQFTDTWKAAQ